MSASKYTLQCNSHKCRAKLSGFAWVTACSHVFCDHHGSEAFSRTPSICPVCSTMLSGKLDVLRTELTPSEQYKAMVLVGLQPETVLEISHNALVFWTYQVWCLPGCNHTIQKRRKGWDWWSIHPYHYCLWLFSGKPGKVADGVQFVQSWGTSASDGEVYDPAEPEQRAWVKCIKRGDRITEKGLKHDHAIKPMPILDVYIQYQSKKKKKQLYTILNNRNIIKTMKWRNCYQKCKSSKSIFMVLQKNS